jgi:hypothetical protein
VNTRIRLLVLPALALALVLGCGPGSQRSASLSGKVSYKGQPVTGGNMTLFFGNTAYPVGLGADGTYSAIQLPEGDATVTVETETLSPNRPTYGGKGGKGGMSSPPPQGSGGVAGTYVKIPAEYASKDKSDLKVTLKRGKNQKDFELTD